MAGWPMGVSDTVYATGAGLMPCAMGLIGLGAFAQSVTVVVNNTPPATPSGQGIPPTSTSFTMTAVQHYSIELPSDDALWPFGERPVSALNPISGPLSYGGVGVDKRDAKGNLLHVMASTMDSEPRIVAEALKTVSAHHPDDLRTIREGLGKFHLQDVPASLDHDSRVATKVETQELGAFDKVTNLLGGAASSFLAKVGDAASDGLGVLVGTAGKAAERYAANAVEEIVASLL